MRHRFKLNRMILELAPSTIIFFSLQRIVKNLKDKIVMIIILMLLLVSLHDVFRLFLPQWQSHQYTLKAKSRSLPRCWLQLHSWIRNSFLVWHHSVLPFLNCSNIDWGNLWIEVADPLSSVTQVSDCTRWSTPFTQTWLEKSPGCCSRSTTPSCCTCWSRPSLCTQRYNYGHIFMVG